jgi:hypothetical protein
MAIIVNNILIIAGANKGDKKTELIIIPKHPPRLTQTITRHNTLTRIIIIAFPVFTKVLQISPVDAKVFSLAIQSVGMVAASIAIIMMRVRVLWRVIVWVSLGGCLGIIISSVFYHPY